MAGLIFSARRDGIHDASVPMRMRMNTEFGTRFTISSRFFRTANLEPDPDPEPELGTRNPEPGT